MQLKVKRSAWSTGRPIAILNKKTAQKLGVHVGNRVLITSKSGSLAAQLDISSKLVGKKQIVLSKEIADYLNLQNKDNVEVNILKHTHQVSKAINKKLKCQPLSEQEIHSIIEAIVKNSLSETEIAFFILSIYKCGMTLDETAYLTKAMLKTGKTLKLKNKFIIDKHCIGGIAGNRTTPLVVAICASEGLTFPKTSSRAITSAAGTADTMEAICNVDFKISEIKKIIKKANACLVWGGGLGLAPADSKMNKVERLISIDPEPNLLASILAKKLSVGSKYIIIDIPYGKSAKVNKKRALDLKSKFEKLGKKFKLKLKVVLTDGSQPIGNGVGPILELRDIFNVLKRDKPPKDLEDKSVFLAGELFELCGKTKKHKGQELARQILNSGKALEKFNQIIKLQGANMKKISQTLSLAKFSKQIKATRNCKISQIDNKQINTLARIAGSPNDKKAGVYLHKHVKGKLKRNEPIITIYSSSKTRLKHAVEFYKGNKAIVLR